MSPEAEREEPELSGRQTTCARAPLFAGSGARITRAESWRCVGNVACRELLSAGAFGVLREPCRPCRSHAVGAAPQVVGGVLRCMDRNIVLCGT